MKGKRLTIIGVFGAVLAMTLFGCATTDQNSAMTQKDQTIAQLKSDLDAQTKMANDADRRAKEAAEAKELSDRRARESLAAREAADQRANEAAERAKREALLPPSTAKAGECYARVIIPTRYRTVTERVLNRQASERVETIPAKYEVVEEKVMVTQASTRLEEVPAEYGWVEENVLVEPARSEWKTGRGLVERVDNTTGEIMCLVEIPARYQTVRRQVVTKPAATRVIEIPAVYETVKVTKLVSPPQEKRIPIPEEYETVTRTERVSEGYVEWRRVLCQTNMTPDMVSKIQSALMQAGHNPGAIDGVMGSQTQMAIKSYQKQKGLAEGDLTYETIESLGVNIN